jgi:hypothetical protein
VVVDSDASMNALQQKQVCATRADILHVLVVLACRLQDPSDLAAQVLSRLSKPDALATCWPLLAPEAANNHARWLQLCVLVMQAAAKQYGHVLLLAMPPAAAASQTSCSIGAGVGSISEAAAEFKAVHSPAVQAAAAAAAELVAAVKQHVRLAARRPHFLDWKLGPSWSVDAAAAALQAQGFVLGDQGTAAEPAAPQLAAGASTEDRAAAMAGWEQRKADLLTKVSFERGRGC